MRIGKAALALSLALTACGGGSDEATDAPLPSPQSTAPASTLTPVTTTPATISAPSTTTEAPSTTVQAEPTVEEIEAEIIAAYLQGWHDFYAVLEDPGLDAQFARATHSQPAFEILVSDQAAVREDGRRIEWPANSKRQHTAEVLELTATTAIVRDCFVNDAYGIYPDGRIVNDDLATSIWSAQMVLEDGRWKTGSTKQLAREIGIWDCE